MRPYRTLMGLVLLFCLSFNSIVFSSDFKSVKAPIHFLSGDGYIRNWIILGPFPNPRDKLDNSDGGYQKDFLSSIGGEDNAKLTYKTEISYVDEEGAEQAAQAVPSQTAYSGIFHFDNVFGRMDYKAAYAFCYIYSETDQKVTSYFGSNDDAKVWVNGQRVHEFPSHRSCARRQDTFTFELKKGLNPVLLKICERWGDWAFVMEVYTESALAQMNQRPIVQSLKQIEKIDLAIAGSCESQFLLSEQTFPNVSWKNPTYVERLLGDFPVAIEWYNDQLEKVNSPKKTGPYIALAEGITSDGILIRKSKTFYCVHEKTADSNETKDINVDNNTLLKSCIKQPFVQLMNKDSGNLLQLAILARDCRNNSETQAAPGVYPCVYNRVNNNVESGLYWLYLPKGYGEKNRKWPLIVYLHGSFQQGRDLSRINRPIPPKVDRIKDDFPFIVVTPQCPDAYDAWPPDYLIDLINHISNQYDVDVNRMVLTGVSLGGRGTWQTAIDYPDYFAAIVPVCGTNDHPEKICRIKKLATWAFHGDADRTVPFPETKAMVESLKACGGNVKFTIFPGEGHHISGLVYKNEDLYDWLLKQKRK